MCDSEESDTEEQPGQRHRVMTEKGLFYQVQQKLKFRRSCDQKLSKVSDNIELLLLENPSKDTVKNEYKKWMQIYEDLIVSHKEYQDLIYLTPTEKIEDDKNFQSRNRRFTALKDSVEDWILRHTTPDNKSVRSRPSTSSSSSHLSMEKLKEQQRKAELVARASALPKRKELEEAKLQLKLKEEELEINTEIEITDAKTKIIEEMERSVMRNLDLEESLKDHSSDKPETKETASLNPCAPPWEDRRKSLHSHETSNMCQPQNAPYVYVPQSTFLPQSSPYVHVPQYTHTFQNTSHEPLPRNVPHDTYNAYIPTPPQTPALHVSDNLVPHNVSSQPSSSVPIQTSTNSDHGILTVARELNKPRSIIQTFDGNPMDYKRFLRQFNTRISSNTDSFEERLNYLLQYTSGEAYKIVLGYSHLDAEHGFKAALDEFKDRYGDADILAQSYVKKALEWPVIKTDDAKALDAYGIFLKECQFAIENVEAARVLEYSENLKLLVKKLPYYLHEKWRNMVYDVKEKHQIVKFQHLVNFVYKEAKKAPIYGRDILSNTKTTTKGFQDGQRSQPGKSVKFSGTHKNFAIAMNESSKNVQSGACGDVYTTQRQKTGSVFSDPCIFCNGGHSLDVCRKYVNVSLKDRYSFLKSKGLCFACLRPGHLKTNCKQKLTCSHCQKLHPTILHVNPQKKDDNRKNSSDGDGSEATALSVAAHKGAGETVKQALPIVPVRLKSKYSDKYVTTYAFLDSGSNATFCLETLAHSLNIEGKRTKLNLVTMGQEKVQDTYVISDLEVSDIHGENTFKLPPVFTQSTLPVSRKDVISPEDLKEWPHLHDIDLNVIECDVGLLIGVNAPKALEPWDVVPSAENGPFAVKTLLGWVINGPLEVTPNDDSNLCISINRVDARRLEEQIRNQFNYDFSERTIDDIHEPSRDDRKFLDLVSKSICFEDGHYQIGLPFKSNDVRLPKNKKQAEQRLSSLVKRFNHDENFHSEYCEFMNKIMNEGYAVKVPTEEQVDGKVWYLPHHGVYHPKKKKLRVVFDCAARFQGTSLNDQLLPGPNLTSSLVGTLLRFRQEEIAVMGDIDSMFYQVHVPKQDASFLRFLWWEDGDTTKKIVEYQMVVHLFGASSSPSCANYALRKTARDSEELFDSEIINTVFKNFYVDDCLKSVKTVDCAIDLIKDIQRLLTRGGFHISKWISNNRDVMMTIPISERAKEVKGLDLDYDALPIERALGVQWCVESDVFRFNIEVNKKPLTRRGILSMISSVFDPLGFLAPFVLRAKKILQELSRIHLGWDDTIPEKFSDQWNGWFCDLQKLSEFRIDRCVKPVGFGTVCSAQLHHFSDASEVGYGIVSYLRLENVNNDVHCSFIMGKSRVAPLKQTSIPRLELTAATVAVRTDKMLKAELDIPIDETVFWTDSMAVLRYIRNETSRFHTFVANRLAVIHEGSTPQEWRYVNTKLNPADYASRGLSANEIVQQGRWIQAPEFLWTSVDCWPEAPTEILRETPDDPEVKKASVRALVADIHKAEPSVDLMGVEKLINHHSSWYTLKKTVAWILKIRSKLLHRIQRNKLIDSPSSNEKAGSPPDVLGHISLQDLQKAEIAILRYVQRETFCDELSTLAEGNSHVKRNSYIRKLDPVLDEDGLLRVGGRLQRANMPIECKHPIILPKNHHISTLILRQIHEDLKHSGRNHMMAVLREKYWLVHAASAIRKLVSKCTICRRQGSSVGEQKMASLPEDRLIPDEPPFTRVGVDYFGPFIVKQKRSHVKRYGVLFTCLTSRAVHLEVAASLDTDSYINALRRFIARRGQVVRMRSDNGTNFVGAERELRSAINEWNVSQIEDSMLQKNIDWKFNPPAGSHHGGVWERIIRSIRKTLNSVLKEQVLDDEGLNTLMCEIESILNGRPITKCSDQHDDLEALTPNHLLLMKTKPNLPPGVFVKEHNYCRRRWKQIQYMANLFWKRWTREYLPLLQERQKWCEEKRNFKVGDIVLVVDSNAPRNSWPMGIIQETLPDDKGFVRQVRVKTSTNSLIRPVDKLCLILEMD